MNGLKLVCIFGEQRKDNTIGMVIDIFKSEDALAFHCTALAKREQPTKPPVSAPISWVCEQRDVIEHQLGTHNHFKVHVLGSGMGANNASKRVAIGYPNGRNAEMLGLRDQLLGMRRPSQKREVGSTLEFGIVGHADSPCTNHLGCISPVSPYKPSR